MAVLFLESTALIDLCFKSQQIQDNVRSHIKNYSELVTSQYVIYEINRGYLRNLVLLYNRSIGLERLDELIDYIKSRGFSSHATSTYLESVSLFLKSIATAETQETLLVRYKAYLQGQIRRSFRKLQKSVDHIVDEVGCRVIKAPDFEERIGFIQNLDTCLCGKVKKCGIKLYFSKHQTSFNKLRSDLNTLISPDAETQKRIRALRLMGRNPTKDFEHGACYSVGDAIIAHEAPTSSSILTSNEKHYGPIADSLGKKLEVYKMVKPKVASP